MTIQYRKAQKNDIPSILKLINELARYEKAPLEVTITEKDLKKDGFGTNPVFEAIVAEKENIIVGMAFYFISYSTWKGKCVYLEDIIVTESMRGTGIGKKLFDIVVVQARKVKAKRLQWQVLNWNNPAINFYEKIGAVLDNEWINCKLTEQQIIDYK